MTEIAYILKSIIDKSPVNVFDVFFVVSFALYAYEEVSSGFFTALYHLVATIVSFFFALAAYALLSSFLADAFSLTKGFSDAIAFMSIGFLTYGLLSIVHEILKRKGLHEFTRTQFDKVWAFLAGSMSYLLLASFVVSLLLSFPISEFVKNQIRDSLSGHFISVRSHAMESSVKKVFGQAINDTLNFLTVKPASDESVQLRFTVNDYTVDEASEKRMLELMNRERAKAGRHALVADTNLRVPARSHAADMLERGYFSHYTPEGFTPFDRLDTAGIDYNAAGENLAFAPEVTIAMDGLMKSPGHRANILSEDYNKVGIGVLDAGIFGKMFVQEFSN